MEEKNTATENVTETKFCVECGAKIAKKAVICPHCGCQVENLRKEEQTQQNQNVIVNNTQVATMVPPGMRAKNKWVSFLLCLFLGVFGAHKFYEGKVGMGILYLLTGGFFGIAVFCNLIFLLFKPNPYYVN